MKHLRIEKETRIRDKGLVKQSDSKLNYVDGSNGNNNNNFQNNGRNKRKYPNGRNPNNSNNYGNNNNKKNKTWYKCGKKCHFKRECRNKKKQKKEGSNFNSANLVEKETSALVAMISKMPISMITELHMVVVTKSYDWWFDSGATIHVCNDKSQFKKYEDAADGHEVLMGNSNSAKVLGRGIIELQFTSGKMLTLLNVLHVPNMKNNLISANLLCKKCIKAMLEADKLILSKN